MSSLNKVTLIGRVGQDPEVRTTKTSDLAGSFSLATSESWKDKNTGQKQEKTEWHNITFFGKIGSVIQNYVKKGSLLYIEGSLSTRKWTDKNNIERYTTEIKLSELKMLGGKDSSGYSAPAGSPATNNSSSNINTSEDVPF